MTTPIRTPLRSQTVRQAPPCGKGVSSTPPRGQQERQPAQRQQEQQQEGQQQQQQEQPQESRGRQQEKHRGQEERPREAPPPRVRERSRSRTREGGEEVEIEEDDEDIYPFRQDQGAKGDRGEGDAMMEEEPVDETEMERAIRMDLAAERGHI